MKSPHASGRVFLYTYFFVLDREYRKSVLFLEGLRKKQLKTVHSAIKASILLCMPPHCAT